MPRLIVHSFTISLDGFGAGPDQSLDAPLGKGGEELHEWLVGTRFFMRMTGRDGGRTGVDDACSRITRGGRWRWRAARPSIS